MIQPQTHLVVADNSGAKDALCIRAARGVKSHAARLGDQIYVVVKSAVSGATVKRKEISRAVIVRQLKPYRRKDGSTIRFDDNAVVLISPDGAPRGTRVFGPVARELRERGYQKILSLAPEVW